MKKKLINIVLALTVVIAGFAGTNMVAQAEEVGVDWTVTYTGSSIESNYEEKYGSSTHATISDAMPGDTLYYEVTYVNGTSAAATFYMNAGVVATLEAGSEATGGAYSYNITNNGTTIFNSNTVGGDNTTTVGLDQVDQGESAYLSLGSVAAGESGVVRVSISLDGNTQDNSYMSTLASLDIQFGAEPTSDADSGESTVETVKNTIVKSVVTVLEDGTEVVIIDDDDVPLTNGGNPQTGDSIMPIVICAIALLIGLMFIIWYFIMTRNQRREEA